jgi:hypothetical protein
VLWVESRGLRSHAAGGVTRPGEAALVKRDRLVVELDVSGEAFGRARFSFPSR